MSDPFTFVADNLWKALEANADFRNLVRPSNRIKLNDGFRPFKSTLMESSVPEVQILPNGCEVWQDASCGGASIDQGFQIIITTGLQNTKDLFSSKWSVLQALYTALNKTSENICDLTWKDESIIKQILVGPAEEGLSYDEFTRELKGWVVVIPVTVKLYFTNLLYGLSS